MDAIGQYGLTCTCENKAARKKIIKNGNTIYGEQCTNCGRFENKGTKFFGWSPPTELADESIKERFRERCQRYWEQKRQEELDVKQSQNREWWQKYNEYLQSPIWASRRAAVLQRDKYLCQGCLRRRAEHVHHLTYDHCFNELAFELISLCVECHKKIHSHMQEVEIDWQNFR